MIPNEYIIRNCRSNYELEKMSSNKGILLVKKSSSANLKSDH